MGVCTLVRTRKFTNMNGLGGEWMEETPIKQPWTGCLPFAVVRFRGSLRGELAAIMFYIYKQRLLNKTHSPNLRDAYTYHPPPPLTAPCNVTPSFIGILVGTNQMKSVEGQ